MFTNHDPLDLLNNIYRRQNPQLPQFPGLNLYRPQGRESVPLPECVKAVLARPVSYYAEKAQQPGSSTSQPMTHVAFALDDSSSMALGKGTTMEGFNRQVKVVKESELAGETRFTEVLFGDNARVRRVAAELSTMAPLTDENYKPEGCTALYDGLGATIAALLQTEGIDSPNTACLVTIFTDGGENNSKQFSAENLRELITRLEATGRWTFALVGPQGSVHTLANLLAVKAGNVKAYEPASVASRETAFSSVVGATSSYMSARAAGATSVMNLYQR